MERNKARGQQRQEEQQRKMEEAKSKEEETMKKLLASLGLKPGDRVTIAKRE